MSVVVDELAGCLRAWRERLTPAAAGLPAGAKRRVSGLRREEVASLAGVSVDYLSRLEQGRAQAPSPSVLASLARALRLSEPERSHLFRLVGHTEPGPGTIDRHVTPGLQRLLDRLAIGRAPRAGSAHWPGASSQACPRAWCATSTRPRRPRPRWWPSCTTPSGDSPQTSISAR